MGEMKKIWAMFNGGASIQQVAWHLMLNTKISNWFEAKETANKLHEEYELTISSGGDIDGNNE